MADLNRRRLLQFAGSTAATLGLSQFDQLQNLVLGSAQRYAQVLAQPTARKLALLVGINRYSTDGNWNPLRGCVNDVLMQQELLVHRFGFKRSDIQVVTDEAATRANIVTAFEEHLIKQAQPGDVVVFHYSGHGSRVVDPDPFSLDPFNSTFVSVDSPLPEDFTTAPRVEVNDIMGQTLFLLMLALKTEQVTAVLDSCHSGGGKRGVLTVRARDGADLFANIHPSETELATQERLRSQLNLSPSQLAELRAQGIAKGVVISSATKDQLAADASFDGFYAGAFTYMLTQYLWQQTVANESVETTITNISRITRAYAKDMSRIVQEPEFEENRPPELANTPIYFVPRQAPAAEAVVLGTKENGNLDLWLGGIGPTSLATATDAIFTALDGQGQPQGQVQIVARDGLRAEARVLTDTRSAPRPGLLLQEEIAGVPENLTLRIGLDPSLGEEDAIAQSTLATFPRLEPRGFDQGEIDYLFGRMTPEYQALQAATVTEVPPIDSLGLFRPGQDIVSGSFGPSGEPIEAAIARLRSKFSVLLATRLLKVLVNPGASQLNVLATMRPLGTDGVSASAQPISVRGQRGVGEDESRTNEQEEAIAIPANIPTDASRLPLGTVVELEIQNRESQDLYISMIVIDAEGNLVLLFPTNWDAPVAASLVQPDEILKVPDPSRDNFRLRLVQPTGIVEVLVIASRFALRDTLRAFGDLATMRGTSRGTPLVGDETFLGIADSLLGDLDRGTRGTVSWGEPGGSRGTVPDHGSDPTDDTRGPSRWGVPGGSRWGEPGGSRGFAQEYIPPGTRSVGNDSLAVFAITFELYDPTVGSE
ncbi:MAG: caspase family protein [Leptolyngbyaceae cyanobacterium]